VSKEDRVVRLSAMRKIISQRMCESLNTTAQFTLTSEMDVDGLNDFVKDCRDAGNKIKIMHVLMKVCASLLDEHELLNAQIKDNQLVYFGAKNIGVAVALDEGLIVPNVKNVDDKTLLETAQAYDELIPRARTRRISPEEMSGGTFTISNLGMAGIDGFTPIINIPESAILGVGRTNERLVLNDDGSLSKKHTIVFSLTVDHRIVDGYNGAMFLKALAEVLNDKARIAEICG